MAPTVHFSAGKETVVSDSSTYWLTIMNIGLGLVVLAGLTAVAIGILQEVAARRRKQAEMSKIDREFANLMASFDAHSLDVPGLGLTMADGGEELKKKEER
jgi:hypothetical protein